jgi:hypothetical protein
MPLLSELISLYNNRCYKDFAPTELGPRSRPVLGKNGPREQDAPVSLGTRDTKFCIRTLVVAVDPI